MDWQGVIAGGLVAGCSARAVWIFLPAAPRAWLMRRLALKAPAAAAAGCGGCSGCGCITSVAGTVQPVKIVRRPRA